MKDPSIAASHVESALGCWTSTTFVPPPDDPLAFAVRRVWLFDGTTTLPRERVFPDGSIEIVVQLDAAYRPVRDVPGDLFPSLSVGGIRTTALTIEGSSRPVRVLGIVMRPAGAFALLRTTLHSLTDLDFDLHDVIGRAAEELGERCTGARSDADCVAAALVWIRNRLRNASAAASAVARAVAQIEAGSGDVAIARLDALGGASRTRFSAAFRDQVGVTPKRFARIVRFRYALDLLTASDESVGAVAARAGYYDQPHMNAEFRAHAGLTPIGYRSAQRYPNSTSLAEQFLQDDIATSA